MVCLGWIGVGSLGLILAKGAWCSTTITNDRLLRSCASMILEQTYTPSNLGEQCGTSNPIPLQKFHGTIHSCYKDKTLHHHMKGIVRLLLLPTCMHSRMQEAWKHGIQSPLGQCIL
jgi:hypothetical protein